MSLLKAVGRRTERVQALEANTNIVRSGPKRSMYLDYFDGFFGESGYEFEGEFESSA